MQGAEPAAEAARAGGGESAPAAGRSAVSWGAPVVSVMVLATFAGVIAVVLLREMPGQSAPLLNVLLGTLAAMATSVVGYWVGSSAGSARKDDLLARQRGPGE